MAGKTQRGDSFDRSKLTLLPLAERHHEIGIDAVGDLVPVDVATPALAEVGAAMRAARDNGASVILMAGAHVIRAGLQRYLIDLMERGLISCVALNGAGVIHDFELALVGGTTEDVAHYLADGKFGLWKETGRLNDIVSAAASEGLGVGEAVGRVIEEEGFPHRDVSVLAAGYRLSVPVTVHVGIGYDIVHEHPNCDGAAWGQTSYRDFLRYARVVEDLEGGVVMNFGSAVMAPEIFLKALAMARNVARADGRSICKFTSLVCDLQPLPADFQNAPTKDAPGYYFRPWKTMLVRTVADGGRSHYVCGDHRKTVPELWSAATRHGVDREDERR